MATRTHVERAFLAAVAAVAVLAAGCGDAGIGTTTSGPAAVTRTTRPAEGTIPGTATTAEPGTASTEADPTPAVTDAPPATAPPASTTSRPAPTTTAAGEQEADVTDGTGSDTSSPDRTLPPDKPLETVPEPPPPSVGEVPAALMDAVLADAGQRAGSSAIQVLRAQAVQWNDGSLGCPEPGQSYTQAIVPGYWVELSAGGTHLDYRLNDRGFFKVCMGPSLGEGGSPSS